MRHPSEEDLVALYYGEAPRAVSAHLEACRECAARRAHLARTLDAIRPADPPLPARHGEQVWERLQGRLAPRTQARPWHAGRRWRTVAMTAAAAMLLAAAFLGGRHWERHAADTSGVLARAGQAPAQRTVLVVLTDHLDRTERLLVSLEHAQGPDPMEGSQLRSEAQELLASNRLYLTAAGGSGDPVLAGALDRLNGVLAEIANDPSLTAEDLQRLRQEMNTRGMLFEIRVLMARRPAPPKVQTHARGRSI